MDTSLQTITLLTVVLTLAVVGLATAVVIRQRTVARRRGIPEDAILPLRDLPAFVVLPQITAQAIESDRPLLLSTGAATIGGESTLVTLAGLDLAQYAASQVAVGQTPPIFMTSETAVLPLGYDTLRRAYQTRGLPNRARLASSRWYAAGERSLVFAAMLTVTLQNDQVSGNIFVGRFGAELALALAAGQRKGVRSIAGSDDLTGQAVAYAMADGALIGEDLFAAGGYLGDRASQRAALMAQDVLRWAVIIVIVAVAITEVSGGRLAELLAPLLNRIGG
ncbi:MAG: DUF6754 domain-containing protein [Phototrophicaceae bacterium]